MNGPLGALSSVEEIVAVVYPAGESAEGSGGVAFIVVLSRAGRRISEASRRTRSIVIGTVARRSSGTKRG